MGWLDLALLFLAGLFLHGVHSFETNSNFHATFGKSPAPFQIDVDKDFISQTKLRASLTRFRLGIDQPDLAKGPPIHNATAIKNYWVDHYDWFEVQGSLNKQ